MNLGQLRTALDRRAGVAMDPAAQTEWVNEAADLIAADHDWPWLQATTTFSTAAGTDTYAVPANWLRTTGLKVPDAQPMAARSRTALDDNWPSSSSGEPYEYAIDAEQLVLRPVPSSVLVVTHRYVRLEPDLVADADLPLMPALFHPAIVEYAGHLVLRRAREAGRAAECLAAYEGWRQRMLDDARRLSGPAKVRVRRH